MIESIRHMNCFVCGKQKQDFEVWSNKLVIGITYDSDFQNNDIISNMSDKDIICHNVLLKFKIKFKIIWIQNSNLFQLKSLLSSKECHWQPKLPAENLCLVT